MHRNPAVRKGFTLIELMAVVLIIRPQGLFQVAGTR